MNINRYHAAGGIVVRGSQVLLLRKITRQEMVLPKGHVEAGETIEEAALREAREETGFHNFRVLTNLGTERSEFQRPERDEYVIRDETYFLMELVDDAPHRHAGYDDAEKDRVTFERHWFPLADAAERLSFEPARTFMRRAAAWVKEHPL
jgi:8-oxo-dGTP pyrophosphatase MutT (NUDIX family)